MIMRFMWMLRQRARACDGATAVEYAVMIGAIIAVIILIVQAVGQSLIPGFETINDQL